MDLLLSAKDLDNPHKLDRSFVDPLIEHFSHVNPDDADVARRALRYIVGGTDSEVVLELGGRASIGEFLRLHQSFRGNNNPAYEVAAKRAEKEREKILWPKVDVPNEVWMRVGQVFEAMFLAGSIKAGVLPEWPGWLKTLLGTALAVKQNLQAADSYWSIDRLEKILPLADIPIDMPVRLLLEPEHKYVMEHLRGPFQAHTYLTYDGALAKISGWPVTLQRHADTVRTILQNGDAKLRTHALQTMISVGADFTPVLQVVVDIACGSAKVPRETALAALEKVAAAARPLFAQMLQDGDSSQRHEAVGALWRLFGQDAREALAKHAEQESSDRVKQTIAKLIAAPTQTGTAEGPETVPSSLELPPLTLPLGNVPLGERARKEIRDFITNTRATQIANYNKAMEEYEKRDKTNKYHFKPHKPAEITDANIDSLLEFLETGNPRTSQCVPFMVPGMWNNKPFDDWFAPPDVQLIHVVRLAYGFQHIQSGGHHGIHWRANQDLEAYRNRCSPRFGLRELQAVVATLPKFEMRDVPFAYLNFNNKYLSLWNWEPEAIWPVFAESMQLLRDAIAPTANRGANYDYNSGTRRENAFKVLATFPQLPSEFIPALWDLALGEGKSDREPAQAALATVANKSAKIIVALEDGKQTVRQAAADWLGKVGDAQAIEPLKEAFRKEKQEIVKGALLAALDALGANVEEFLDRKKLLKEAEAGLAKKKPKNMDWFPLESMPALHWQDTGKAVDPAIVQWWAVQSIAQKSPTAGPLLRRYLQMCRPLEATHLSRWVLRCWIGGDTAPLSHDEAAERAKKESDQQWGLISSHQFYKDHYDQLYQGKKENMYQAFYTRHLTECKGSAIGEKGILALAAAAGDAECVKLAEQYIRKWFGQRLAQCKALIEVLAWIEHPTAIQALLSIGNRFRTKAIREAAAEHVKALAERQGWTLDELADRTLPDAGFERPLDDEGRPVGDVAKLVLDYGPRTFTVQLNDDLDPVIATAEGKTVKAPPAPGKNDDPEKAKEAKKRFSDAKKTVKQVVKSQSERLYEAMCTQRRWKFDDWQRYLAQHPIVGRLCCNLVWCAFAEKWEDAVAGKLLGCFRPLEDGTLTNEKDEAVQLPGDTVVRLAHTCSVTPELESAWKQHLDDYDITPVFHQFGRSVFTLPEKQRKENEIKDFEGHILSNFKLRGKATRLGYMRGPAEDGGWFHLYRKPFVSLEIEAVIHFTGSGLPEEDRTVALLSFAFQRLKKDGNEMGYFDNAGLALEKVPSVVLSECYNDVKQIAAEGSGFDPEWSKKSYY